MVLPTYFMIVLGLFFATPLLRSSYVNHPLFVRTVQLIDGKEFDSSIKRGKMATFKPSQVVRSEQHLHESRNPFGPLPTLLTRVLLSGQRLDRGSPAHVARGQVSFLLRMCLSSARSGRPSTIPE